MRRHPRLLSNNGTCYVLGELRDYLSEKSIRLILGAPNHPMTWGKIERNQQCMKNLATLQHYCYKWKLEIEITHFVDY